MQLNNVFLTMNIFISLKIEIFMLRYRRLIASDV